MCGWILNSSVCFIPAEGLVANRDLGLHTLGCLFGLAGCVRGGSRYAEGLSPKLGHGHTLLVYDDEDDDDDDDDDGGGSDNA